MLTPEEVTELLLPVNVDYIKQHGVDRAWLTEADYVLLVHHHRRLMTQPLNQRGKPFTGLAYDFYYGHLWRYTEIRDGYHFGDDAAFYEDGKLQSYERKDDEEHYRYDWYENGGLQAVTEWNRKDHPEYCRQRYYGADGRLLLMKTKCEFEATYNPNAADSPFDFTFYENGEFRQITLKAPSARDFYSVAEFDPDGIPMRFFVNPHYTEDSLDKRLKEGLPRCEILHSAKYRFYRGYLEYSEVSPNSGRICWWRASACIHFRNGREGDTIIEYKKGVPEGKQCVYYPSGKIREQYFLSDGKECFRHIYWHPNGIIREAIVYARDGAVMLHVTFDDKGYLGSYQFHADVCKQAYRQNV